jgi:hypothetical protein
LIVICFALRVVTLISGRVLLYSRDFTQWFHTSDFTQWFHTTDLYHSTSVVSRVTGLFRSGSLLDDSDVHPSSDVDQTQRHGHER